MEEFINMKNVDLLLENFNPEDVRTELDINGAVSLPLIPEERRLRILHECIERNLRLLLRRDLSGMGYLELESLIEDIEGLFNQGMPRALNGNLLFNDISMMTYRKEGLGIVPHDDAGCKNIIGVVMLGGFGQFYTCESFGGSGRRNLDSTPGNIIFMKANRFMGASASVIHGVDRVIPIRRTLVFQQSD